MTLPSPQTFPEFARMFPGERECEQYLFALRWPDGFKCPKCDCGKHYWIADTRKAECAGCGEHVYLTAGTILHKAHTPLLTWFYGAFIATTLTPGISAVQFQKQLGLKRYETAFQILHKLRAAMVNPEREMLHDVVEVDETYVGGALIGGKGGRATDENKTIVIGAVEQIHAPQVKRGVRAGRVRFRVIEGATTKELSEFIEAHIKPESTILTDGWKGYARLAKMHYDYQPTVEGHHQNAATILPLIHLEFSNLKTWLNGTHHGRVERQHLQAYLNEFAFRHNRRFWRFTAFQTVLRLGMKQGPQEYRDLYDTDEYGKGVHAA